MVDTNLALLQKRAEAVVAAFVADRQSETARPSARDAANFLPPTSNGLKAGRARNRRVKLVER